MLRYISLLILVLILGCIQFAVHTKTNCINQLKKSLNIASQRKLENLEYTIYHLQKNHKLNQEITNETLDTLLSIFSNLTNENLQSYHYTNAKPDQLYTQVMNLESQIFSQVSDISLSQKTNYNYELFKSQEEHKTSTDSVNLLFFPVVIDTAYHYDFILNGNLVSSSTGIVEGKESYSNQNVEIKLTDKKSGEQITIKERIR